MKTAISIPDPIFNAAERLAKRLGMSRSELYRKAVNQFIDAHSDRNVTMELNQVYGEEDSKLDPMLEKMQAASVIQEEW